MNGSKYPEELEDYPYSEEMYMYLVYNKVPESIISDEYWDRNSLLLSEISNSFFDMDSRNRNMPPELTRKVIEEVFSLIKRYGIR